MLELRAIARYVVFAVFCAAVLIAFAGWIVRARRVSPFGALGRMLRTVSDPFTRPIERRLVRAGSNPIHAGWWLVIGTAIVGVLLLSLLDWVMRLGLQASAAAHGGPRVLIELAIVLVYNVLIVALVVRVLGTWVGMFRYSRWMRPAYLLTDWLVEPIRRILPPMGPLDLSPLAAWFALWALKQLLLAVV